jgi:hypothetical protein
MRLKKGLTLDIFDLRRSILCDWLRRDLDDWLRGILRDWLFRFLSDTRSRGLRSRRVRLLVHGDVLDLILDLERAVLDPGRKQRVPTHRQRLHR